MSKIYEYLKKKVNDPNCCHELYYNYFPYHIWSTTDEIKITTDNDSIQYDIIFSG